MNADTPHRYVLIRGAYVPVEGGQTPERATALAAGFDCFARTGGHLLPGERAAVPLGFRFLILDQVLVEDPGEMLPSRYWDTGFGIELDQHEARIESLDHSDVYEFDLRPRSGLALKHGITLLNSPGTIDADYPDEVMAIIINHGDHPFRWEAGTRICQAVWPNMVSWTKPHEGLRVKEDKRVGGFGSTGGSAV